MHPAIAAHVFLVSIFIPMVCAVYFANATNSSATLSFYPTTSLTKPSVLDVTPTPSGGSNLTQTTAGLHNTTSREAWENNFVTHSYLDQNSSFFSTATFCNDAWVFGPCCQHFNSHFDTAAFASWMTADDLEPSPPPSASLTHDCCGGCTYRAKSIDLYYWPSAADLITCTSERISVNTWYNITHNRAVHYVTDPAYGCNGSGPGVLSSPYTTVVYNHTLTSPTPYMRFTSFWAYNYCSRMYGKARLAMAPLCP
jgi:hypothetical protein